MALPSIDQTFERVKIVGKFPLTAGAPVDAPEIGTYRFDEATDTLYVYNGTAWVSVVLT